MYLIFYLVFYCHKILIDERTFCCDSATVLHHDTKNSFRQLRRADDALPRAHPVCLCVRAIRDACMYTFRFRARETRYNARHAHHNGANLFNLTNNKLIS